MWSSKEELVDAFSSDPEGLVKSLLDGFELRGQVRDWLTEHIVESPGDPRVAPYFWIPLMPWYLSVDFTAGVCNLKCRMCSGRSMQTGKLAWMTKRQIHKILRNVPTAEMLSLPSESSDPLMNPDLLPVLEMLRERGLQWGMVSNGHLLKPSVIREVASYPHHVEFNVSIDTVNPSLYKEIRGADMAPLMDRLMELRAARDACPESGFTLSVMMVGMEENIGELAEMVELCARIRAKALKVQHFIGDKGGRGMKSNPDWPSAVARGVAAAERLGIQLFIPHDMRPQTVPETPPAAKASGTKGVVPPNVRRMELAECDIPPAEEGPPKILCPRFDNLQIKIDGTMAPCCHLRTYFPLRMNIFDGPIHRNQAYLRYRLHFFSGGIMKECLPAPNCYAMQKLRMRRDKGEPAPPLKMEVEGLPSKPHPEEAP